jgi:hypothetical protein
LAAEKAQAKKQKTRRAPTMRFPRLSGSGDGGELGLTPRARALVQRWYKLPGETDTLPSTHAGVANSVAFLLGVRAALSHSTTPTPSRPATLDFRQDIAARTVRAGYTLLAKHEAQLAAGVLAAALSVSVWQPWPPGAAAGAAAREPRRQAAEKEGGPLGVPASALPVQRHAYRLP